jgi:hypothetical protein
VQLSNFGGHGHGKPFEQWEVVKSNSILIGNLPQPSSHDELG